MLFYVPAVNQSARVDDNSYAPPAVAVHGHGRRPNERIYEGTNTFVRAVLVDNAQRCWIEREQAAE